MTSGINLTKCFENQGCNTETASKKWLKEYKNILQRCFKKIRITSKDKSSDIIKTIQNKSRKRKMFSPARNMIVSYT